MNKIKAAYKKAIKAQADFTAQLQLLEKEFVFTGFGDCEPHILLCQRAYRRTISGTGMDD